MEGSKGCVTGQRVGAQLHSHLGFFFFALFASREYMGILMLPRTSPQRSAGRRKQAKMEDVASISKALQQLFMSLPDSSFQSLFP